MKLTKKQQKELIKANKEYDNDQYERTDFADICSDIISNDNGKYND